MRKQKLKEAFSGNWGVYSLSCHENSFMTCFKPVLILTLAPPWGWWIIILECGKECLIPGDPAARSKEAIEQAWPTHQVAIGGCTYCMVS